MKRCPVCKKENPSKGVTCGKVCGVKQQRKSCNNWWKKNKAEFSKKLRELKAKKRYPHNNLQYF